MPATEHAMTDCNFLHNFHTLTHYQTTNFRLFQADDNFEFYENGRKLSKQVENIVRKGEIACYKLLPRGVKRCHCVGMG